MVFCGRGHETCETLLSRVMDDVYPCVCDVELGPFARKDNWDKKETRVKKR